jgi:hypothetical protein
MKTKKILPLFALSLALAGCSSLENAVLSSDIGKRAVVKIEDGYLNNYGKEARIEDYGIAEKEDQNPEKPILFFIHGWGSSLKEFEKQEKITKYSKLDIMKEVFEERVIMADYPSDNSMDNLFSELETPFFEFINNYKLNNNGKNPKLILVGNSMGTQVARLFGRKYPEYFIKEGLIAGVNEGLNFGILTPMFKQEFPKYMKKVLVTLNKIPSEENYQCVKDLTTKSAFMKKINTPTSGKRLECNFYGFISNKNSLLIPDRDDGLVSYKSSYPLDLIKKNKFENIQVGEVLYFEGELDHFSLNNFDVLRKIMLSLKSEKTYSSVPPSYKEVPVIKVLKLSSFEQQRKQEDEQLIKKK